MAKIKAQTIISFRGGSKVSRPGVHSKTKTSHSKSSKNYNHIVVTDRMVDNFFYKWRMDLTEKSIIEFKGQYLKEKKMVLGNF